eukprot:363859-Chlamydomonas_euryale.AAC.3
MQAPPTPPQNCRPRQHTRGHAAHTQALCTGDQLGGPVFVAAAGPRERVGIAVVTEQRTLHKQHRRRSFQCVTALPPMAASFRDKSQSQSTGSGPTKGMPVLSAARQRGSSSGLGAVTKGTPLRTALSHPIPTPTRQPC